MMRIVTLAMVTALWACGESNEAPRVVGTIADLFVGVSALIDLDSIFEDPDGDRLLYDATFSVAEMTELTGAALRVTGTDKGTATVTVSACGTAPGDPRRTPPRRASRSAARSSAG